jgi:hypothetical protein
MNQLEKNRAGTAFWVVFSCLHLLLALLLVAVLLPCGQPGKGVARNEVPVRAGTPPYKPTRTVSLPRPGREPIAGGRGQISPNGLFPRRGSPPTFVPGPQAYPCFRNIPLPTTNEPFCPLPAGT